MIKYLALAVLLSAPLAALATPVSYTFAGTGAGGSTGHMEFNPSSSGNIIGSLVDWSFSWNGFTFDETNTVLYSASSFTVDTNFDFISATIYVSRTGGTSTSDAPTFAFSSSGGVWRAIAAVGGADSGIQTGFTVTRDVGEIPEPASLALVALALVGAAAARRRV